MTDNKELDALEAVVRSASSPFRTRPRDVAVAVLAAGYAPPIDVEAHVEATARRFAEGVGWQWDGLDPMWHEQFRTAARESLTAAVGTKAVR